jgi:hypothetical protein
MPAAEAQAADDPALPGVMAPDPPLRVVQAAAIAVHEPPRRVGDQLALRRHPVLQWHRAILS